MNDAIWPILASGCAILVADHYGKSSVRSALGESKTLSLAPWFRLCCITNRQRFHRLSPLRLSLIWALAAISGIVLAYQSPVFERELIQIGLGAALGGALSNRIDQIRLPGITDYLEVRGLPAFNIADVGIVGGIVLVLFSVGRLLLS